MKKLIILLPTLSLILVMTSCTPVQGKKVSHGHVDVYYKEGIPVSKAQQTADLLFEADSLVNKNTKAPKSIQLAKEGDTIYFRMVVIESKLPSLKDETFYRMGSALSDRIFEGRPVNIDLTDNHFKTLRTIRFNKSADMEQDQIPDKDTGRIGGDPASLPPEFR